MTKSIDNLTEVLSHAKHPFRQVDARPEKPKKSRYERRKLKECLRSELWMGASAK